ncbi:hypothetical protein MHYP_G00184780 [Metynnis hypsauchen]
MQCGSAERGGTMVVESDEERPDRDAAAAAAAAATAAATAALHQCQLLQNMIEISISSLQGLRTKCAATNDLTQHEIRTLEKEGVLAVLAQEINAPFVSVHSLYDEGDVQLAGTFYQGFNPSRSQTDAFVFEDRRIGSDDPVRADSTKHAQTFPCFAPFSGLVTVLAQCFLAVFLEAEDQMNSWNIVPPAKLFQYHEPNGCFQFCFLLKQEVPPQPLPPVVQSHSWPLQRQEAAGS